MNNNQLVTTAQCSDSSRIIITLGGEIEEFDSKSTFPGLVMRRDALSKTQLARLSQDIEPTWDLAYEGWFPSVSPLYFDGEDVEVLKLICNHPYQRERKAHLRQFMLFKQGNIYVSEWVTKKSLSDLHACLSKGAYHARPFMVKLSSGSSAGHFPDDLNYLLDTPVNRYLLENLYLLNRKYPDIKIECDVVENVIMTLSDEEQEEMVRSYTLNQIKALMDYNCYKRNILLRKLHLKRVKQNYPIIEFPFTIRMAADRKVVVNARVMTQAEAEDFQAILDKTKFAIFDDVYMSPAAILGLLAYLYLELGNKDFIELLQYLQHHQQKRGSMLQEDTIYQLEKSFVLQKAIVDASKLDATLPLSLKLEFNGFDWDTYTKDGMFSI
jgi:hypothetical protein